MRVRYFAWFDSKQEQTEFIALIRSCNNDLEAINKVMDKYPQLSMSEIRGIVDNFKKELKQP